MLYPYDKYCDIELARERAYTRGVSIRDEFTLGSDIDLQLDTIPGADESMFIEPLSMIPLTPDSEMKRDEQYAAMEVPIVTEITAKAKRAAKIRKIILDVDIELYVVWITRWTYNTNIILTMWWIGMSQI